MDVIHGNRNKRHITTRRTRCEPIIIIVCCISPCRVIYMRIWASLDISDRSIDLSGCHVRVIYLTNFIIIGTVNMLKNVLFLTYTGFNCKTPSFTPSETRRLHNNNNNTYSRRFTCKRHYYLFLSYRFLFFSLF